MRMLGVDVSRELLNLERSSIIIVIPVFRRSQCEAGQRFGGLVDPDLHTYFA